MLFFFLLGWLRFEGVTVLCALAEVGTGLELTIRALVDPLT